MPPDELLRLRDSIDNIDAALIYLLAERFKCTQQVGRLKARIGLPASDPGREAQQVARLRALAEGARGDPAPRGDRRRLTGREIGFPATPAGMSCRPRREAP
jgi:monofunctional chorismate mutase